MTPEEEIAALRARVPELEEQVARPRTTSRWYFESPPAWEYQWADGERVTVPIPIPTHSPE